MHRNSEHSLQHQGGWQETLQSRGMVVALQSEAHVAHIPLQSLGPVHIHLHHIENRRQYTRTAVCPWGFRIVCDGNLQQMSKA